MTNWRDFIGCDYTICHGQPCFRINGKLSRILVSLILEMLEAEENTQDILYAYPQLSSPHIKAALCYAAEVIKTGETVPFAKVS